MTKKEESQKKIIVQLWKIFEKIILQLPGLFKREREELRRITQLIDSVDDTAKQTFKNTTENATGGLFEVLRRYYRQKDKTLVVLEKKEVELIKGALKEYSKNTLDEKKKELVETLLKTDLSK